MDKKNLSNEYSSYVTSFSEDGDMLSQWRGYSKPADGYSIGFDTKSLIDLSEKQNFFLQPCEYDESNQREFISRFLKEGLNRLNDDIGRMGLESAKNSFIIFCVLSFMHVAPIIKNRAFRQELEWRLITLPAKGLDIISQLAFRSGKSMLIPYVPFKLAMKNEDVLPIADLVIVPCPHDYLDSLAVLSLLVIKRVINNSCRRSVIPYRDW